MKVHCRKRGTGVGHIPTLHVDLETPTERIHLVLPGNNISPSITGSRTMSDPFVHSHVQVVFVAHIYTQAYVLHFNRILALVLFCVILLLLLLLLASLALLALLVLAARLCNRMLAAEAVQK